MAIDQDQRPRYYEDQFLGAKDLNQAVDYGRIQQARHELGGHIWGIGVGLELFEKPWPGNSNNRVDLFVTPGYAWDGYGRPVVVLAPTKIPEALFADIKYDPNNSNDKEGKGRLIKVWLQYDEASLRTPAPGFESCKEGDQTARIQETFRIVIGERGKAEQRDSVIINGQPVDPSQALNFPPSTAPGPKTLYDESVPYQEIPIDGPPDGPPLPVWLIPLGYVRWLPVQSGGGYFVKRNDAPSDPSKEPDSDLSRRVRRYAGVVAESIEAAGGVIRLRNRVEDPTKHYFRPPLITTDPNNAPENDLVWIEGDLRVVGNTRLAGGELAFRTQDGKEEGTPIEIRRVGDGSGNLGARSLQVLLGPDAQEDNKFTIGPKQSGNAIDPKFVVTSGGNVGIATDTPAQQLTIQSSHETFLEITSTSPSLPWKSDGTLNEGSFVINQQSANSTMKADADFALMRDRKKRMILGDTDTYLSSQDRVGQKGKLRFFLNYDEAGAQEVMHIDDRGNVGIGTINPIGKLTIGAAQHLNVILDRTDTSDHMTLTVGSNGTGIHFGNTNRFFISADPYAQRNTLGFGNELLTILPSGRVGIGTNIPAGKIDIDESSPEHPNSRLKIGHTNLGYAHHIISFRDLVLNSNRGFYFRHNARVGDPTSVSDLVRITAEGKVGIRTINPQHNLHVNGSAAKSTGAFWTISSDERLKKNIEPLTGALASLLRLRGVSFEWREPEKQANLTGKQIGLIAQEVEAVFPEWVGTNEEGYKDLTVRGFEALTIEAFKEVKQLIDQLDSKIKSSRGNPPRRLTSISKNERSTEK